MKQAEISYNTKKALAQSLKNFMKKKPFSKITVSELINDCNINRKTFYYHFEDIYDLLKWMFEEEAIDVVKNFDLLVDYEEAITFVMDYVEKNDHIISCAYDSIGQEGMKRFFYADFYDVTLSVIKLAETQSGHTLSDDFRIFMTKFYTNAVAEIFLDWVKNHDTQDRRKTTEYLTAILRESIKSVLLNTDF
ncbi:MAG: TetR/AcrR family transcriptional regulator C-terminal domain-containing protein [Eubacteriales bacterium]|nr:TetR/AcrR family transcriptional regulator C-terminal domain-containing protein [Eubacteriales bacterium]